MAQLAHKAHLDILEYLVVLDIAVLMAHQVTAGTQELVGILALTGNLEHLVTQGIVDQAFLDIADILEFLDIAELMVNLDILESQVLVVTQVLMAHLDTQELADFLGTQALAVTAALE